MATLQMSRTPHPPQQKSWEAIFPNEQVTEQKSALFVKKLLAVAISSVTYLRAIFPEHAFGDKCLEDLNLKVLRDESSCPGACQVIRWIKGCFDALDKKYLKTLVLGVFTDPSDPETLLESFTFKFSYKNHGEIDIYRNDQKVSSACSAEETKKATIMLLRTLVILTNTLKPLPEHVMMTIKLFYFDDVTPSDYEPPGFKPSNDNNFQFLEDVTNIAIGEVSTPFHTLKLRVKTGSDQFVIDPNMSNEAMNVALINKAGKPERSSEKDYNVTHQTNAVDVNEQDTPNAVEENIQSTEPDITSKNPADDKVEEEFPVRCPCGCNEDDGLMIMCSICNTWQHGVCFLITDESKAPAVHTCEFCAQLGNSDSKSTDPKLTGMSAVAIQATCLWRRTLMACLEFKRILAPQLARRLGVEPTVAQGLINRLEKEGFVSTTAKGKKLGKMVDKEKIKRDGIPCYLKTPKTLQNNLSRKSPQQECPLDEEMIPSAISDSGISSEKMSTMNETKESNNAKAITAVNSLVTKTNKMNLEEKNKGNHHSPQYTKANKMNLEEKNKGNRHSSRYTKSQDSDFATSTKGRGKKRVYSRLDNSEFELNASQDGGTSRSKRKKASIVKKHLVV